VTADLKRGFPNVAASFVLGVFGEADAPQRQGLLRALDVEDDGSLTFEIGRAETGATCALVHEGGADAGEVGSWTVHLPLVRSPTSAHDILPPLVEALRSIGAGLDVIGEINGVTPRARSSVRRSADELIAAWTHAHVEACQQLARVCAAQDLPPPPHLPGEELARLHAWLVAIAALPDVAKPILGLDPADGRPALLAVGLPDEGAGRLRVPPVHVVLKNLGRVTRMFPTSALGAPDADGFFAVDLETLALEGGEPITGLRVVSPVEIVDDEALGAPL
jgi:hypothetical protein